MGACLIVFVVWIMFLSCFLLKHDYGKVSFFPPILIHCVCDVVSLCSMMSAQPDPEYQPGQLLGWPSLAPSLAPSCLLSHGPFSPRKCTYTSNAQICVQFQKPLWKSARGPEDRLRSWDSSSQTGATPTDTRPLCITFPQVSYS